MEEIVIYVAGNPNIYPIEYYDPGTGTYQGMIPELLRLFSDQTVYDIQYYDPGKDDQRETLAAHCQVDVISGCDGSEMLAHQTDDVVLFETERDGMPVFYRLYLTDAAPASLGVDLRSFLAGVSQETKTGLLLETAEQRPPMHQAKMQSAIFGLTLTVLVLTIVITVLIRRHRRRMEVLEENKEIDATTGIGNKDYLIRCFQDEINDENRILYDLFYFYIDVEQMEEIGGYGDIIEFSCHVAMILKDCTSDTDFLARVSDDGFAFLRLSAGGWEKNDWFLSALERIRSFLKSREAAYAGGVAVGVYPLKADDRNLNEVIFRACQSARNAYKRGEDYEVCTEEMIHIRAEEKMLRSDIRRGFQEEEFQIHIQFYADARTGRILGGEALSRWEHPEKGLLLPDYFAALMEKEGMLRQLDYYGLDKACAFLEALQRVGVEDFFISCNFSRETLSAGDFISRCEEIMERYRFVRELLIFEIDASASISQSVTTVRNIKALKDRGIRIVLNDFGEGVASIVDIQKYPIDGLKLGKDLVDNVEIDSGAVILCEMIRMGHELGVTVMAEGVETGEQARLLREMNCDVIQGDYFYHPVPLWEAKRKLMEQAGRFSKKS